MRVCLVEDAQVGHLEPLALARPAFELLCGTDSLQHKQLRYFDVASAAVLLRSYLAPLYRQTHPNAIVNDVDWLKQGPVLLINARWLPSAMAGRSFLDVETLLKQDPFVAMVGREVAYAVLHPQHLADAEEDSLDLCLHLAKETLPSISVEGTMIEYLWQLVDHNAEQITEDFELFANRPNRTIHPHPIHVNGPSDRLWIDPSAKLDPLVVADTTNGPVIIDRDAVVHAFSRLEGPCYIGRGTHILGAKVRGGTTFGPNCRMGGEIEVSIVQGNSNKYHDGFLGHSYLGEWVNLGAGTHTSDLRCDYGEVTLTINGARVNTGLRKVGAFIGDHTKTGLGTLLNTGTNVGVFCNLLPSGELLPKYVPSFCSVLHGRVTDTSELSPLFGTATVVMKRRGFAFSMLHQSLFRHLLEQTNSVRRQALREADLRRLRASA
ncbi:putative sugar nucleotidyl transferase [Tuwongella immobilis]|uniref:Glucose-1-phosphate thymidylyltransferase n=1 Tax=Tuwongella immobilis TaxID=692036 RepID=A0A6C2YH06_9BACT|nr:putative sugar nucleotidyl transferase [Tuwongella immobilis]VIP00697.1 UDP-N-acetylglucosamine diphosphorylase/glucosamine-1-phosphate N-acetyltransferase OS=Singulisphaera acidiphila (strain ATCC BAA-1392 / DSM 18658 / VKM B-2454 / MOB10) GN=Sinac_3268 PE=4 SV=1: NTP_transf_4 [Tuwongella immobilis]VTR96812.1 UDP-N-acetylglucosamine diphosphorylase/glucosamine-1-phosphate N-acetyltransferase OS=Singulisphaera acidiphila (strain ATCC BAA-1392 / DSM 18658 / VKM B-2454 / MOB10) GN=Sinac_3268 PE=